jgi:hypothetical protein
MAEDHPSFQLVDAAAGVPVSQPTPIDTEHVAALTRSAFRAWRLQQWRNWLETQAKKVAQVLEPLLQPDTVPLAAADGTSLASQRCLLGKVFGGEVTLARTGKGLLLEWTSDLPPGEATGPSKAFLGEQELEAVEGLPDVDRAWLIPSPPVGKLKISVVSQNMAELVTI